MSITKTREKVRDGYLGDLPEALQTKVMNIHKLIKDTVHDLLDNSNYEDLKSSNWAMSCIDEFCVMPKDKSEVGSIRVYKNGKTYRCMIQATGHFRNHQYGWIEELLHDFIGNVYTTIRPKIRRKYDMTITNEGRTGEPFEGFDIYPNPKTVKDIWDSLEDRKTKTITESMDRLPTNKSAAMRLSWKLFTEIRGAVGTYIDNHVGMFHELLDEMKIRYRDISRYHIYGTPETSIHVEGGGFKVCNWCYDDEDRACVDKNKYKGIGYISIKLYAWHIDDAIDETMKKFFIDANGKLRTMTIDKMKQLGYVGELFFDYGNCGGTDKSYGTAYWIIRYDELVPELSDDIQKKVETYNLLEDRLHTESYDVSPDNELYWSLYKSIRSAGTDYIEKHAKMVYKTFLDVAASYPEVFRDRVFYCEYSDERDIGKGSMQWADDRPDRSNFDRSKYEGTSYSVIALYDWSLMSISDDEKCMDLFHKLLEELKVANNKLISQTPSFVGELTYTPEEEKTYWAMHVDAGTYGRIHWVIPTSDMVAQFPQNLQEKYKQMIALKEKEESGGINEYYRYYSNMSYDDYFYEKSHGLLKSSFRMGINKENGHLIKLVFDLKSDDVTLVGSHDDTHPIPDEDQDKIAKNIRKTGFTDFASTGVCKAIVDMDTNEKLQTVKCVGIMNGAAPWAKKPLKEREKDIANGASFGGAKTYTVGQSEASGDPRRRYLQASYKTTKAPRNVDDLHNIVNGHRQGRGYVKEATSSTPEYNVDMSEAEAKRTLRTLSQSIINDTTNKKGYKVSQYTANIYANIITKNLLPIWAKGFRKFSITLDSYQSFNTFEFKVPNMTQDFVSRFINGRESINGFVHRNAEIRVKMSPRIFHTMKNPDDAYRFFKAAIKYYDSGLEKATLKMMAEVMKLNTEMKHLISTTKLSGIVTYPMTLLFVFDDVSMDNIDTFRITNDDITTVNKFIRSIYTRYAAPDKEKKKIVDDVKELVKSLRESCDTSEENIRDLTHFPEAVGQYLSGGFDSEMALAKDRWIHEQIDYEWDKRQTGQMKYIKEAFGVKKLKKIPTDLVAYISIETEAIRDANDKMMISSYCLGKIEIVEWYIELLEVGSKKYIVPHTKPYLQSVRTQLLACFKKIMDTPIPKADRPLIDITYPKGYEG